MPYTLKTQQISVKDPDSGEYIGVDVLTEQTKEGLIAELQAEGDTQIERINQAAVDVQSAVDQAETEAQQLISSTQSSLNTLETQKDTIAQTIASMAELGTDTMLTTAGMAADAKATGGVIKPQTIKFDCVVGANIFECAIIPGCTYRCINNAGGRISVSSCTENGTEIEQVLGGEYTKDRTFIPTQIASYVRIYSGTYSGEVIVYNEDNPNNNFALFKEEISDEIKSVAVINRGEFFWGDTPIIENETVNAGTGAISTSNGWERTDYISLDNFPLELKIQNNFGSSNHFAVFYDQSKVFTGYIKLPDSSTTIVTPPENSAYFILYCAQSNGGLKAKYTLFGFASQVNDFFSKEIDGYVLPTQKVYSCVNGNNIIPLHIFNGHTYRMTNNTSAAISIDSCTQDGTNIENMAYQFSAGATKTFTVTKDANYVRIYLVAELGNVTVYDESGNLGNSLDKLKDDVSALQGIVQAKAERPASGYEDFSISINCHEYTDNTSDGEALYTDYGVVALPTNYSPSADPTKLIILCGGNAERIGVSTNPSTFHGWAYYLAKGYAVMDMNGMPTEWATEEDFPISNKHFCNKFLIDSYKKGYEYVIRKYNIDDTQVFVSGISMGGGASALLVQSGIFPVVAHCMFCPALSVYKQDYLHPWNTEVDQKKTIAGQWGFDNWETTETFDQAYFLANINKISGFDNLLIRTIGDFDTANAHYGDATETEAYNAMKKFYPVPVKLWHCVDDSSVYYRYSQYFVNMIKNAGGQAWLRSFDTGGHTGGWNTGSVSDVDIDGNTVTTSIPFYESILFFKRFG